jgi:hypothetical protein
MSWSIQPFPFEWRETFEQEMWKLWRHRLITEKQVGDDKVLEKMKTRGHGDVKNYFEITDAGKEYLRLIEETDSTGEARIIL